MKHFTIWIDADSCPSLVRNHVTKTAAKEKLTVNFVANKSIKSNNEFPFNMIVCSDEKDAADNYIFENAAEADLVITRDIVFADRLVSKNICCINDRGTIFSRENIKELLSERNFDFELAQIGLVKHYNEGYNKQKFAKFANCFDKIIHQLGK